MKKAALILGILFIVGAGTVFWILHHLGPSKASELVPKNTVALIEVPDLAATTVHWQNSELGRMGAEADIKAFLEKPLHWLYQWSGLAASGISPKAFADLLIQIKPGRFFAAVAPAPEEVGWVVGCQFFGDKAAVDEGMVPLTKAIEGSFGSSQDVTLDSKEHQGEVITQKTYASLVLVMAFRGNWCFVSNSADLLQSTLDFSAGRLKKQDSLAAAELYQKNRAHLLPEADLLFYVKHGRFMGKIPYCASLLREQPLVKNADAVGSSLRFVEDGLQERMFFNGDFHTKWAISHEGIHFTQPTTLGYVERINDWEQIASRLQNNPMLPPDFAQFLTVVGLDFSSLAPLLKPEVALALDWTQGRSLPSVFLAVPEEDSNKVAGWMDQAASKLGTSVQTSGPKNLLTLPISRVGSLLQPLFASWKGSFFVATEPSLVQQISEKNNLSSNLEASPDFAKYASLYRAANEVFVYCSTKQLFERVYDLARPSLQLATASLPGVKEIIDVAKLPPADILVKHLTSIVVAQSHVNDGFLIQARGPLGATPLYLLGKWGYSAIIPQQAAPDASETDEPMEEQEPTLPNNQ